MSHTRRLTLQAQCALIYYPRRKKNSFVFLSEASWAKSFSALCKNLKEEWKSGYGFFFLSDSAVSVKFKILKSQPTQEPTTYLLNNMCWYNNTLMNLVETALHCTIHITRHTYTTYKKFEKMGVSNQTSIKQKWSSGYTYKIENIFQSSQNRNPCLVTHVYLLCFEKGTQQK